MATVKIKGSNENEEYTIEIDDIFIQKLNTADDVIKFINGMVDLVKEQTKLKSLSVLEKQTDCIANKIAVILNGITETVRVLQTGNIFSIKPDTIDNRSPEEVEKDINDKFIWAKEEIK